MITFQTNTSSGLYKKLQENDATYNAITVLDDGTIQFDETQHDAVPAYQFIKSILDGTNTKRGKNAYSDLALVARDLDNSNKKPTTEFENSYRQITSATEILNLIGSSVAHNPGQPICTNITAYAQKYNVLDSTGANYDASDPDYKFWQPNWQYYCTTTQPAPERATAAGAMLSEEHGFDWGAVGAGGSASVLVTSLGLFLPRSYLVPLSLLEGALGGGLTALLNDNQQQVPVWHSIWQGAGSALLGHGIGFFTKNPLLNMLFTGIGMGAVSFGWEAARNNSFEGSIWDTIKQSASSTFTREAMVSMFLSSMIGSVGGTMHNIRRQTPWHVGFGSPHTGLAERVYTHHRAIDRALLTGTELPGTVTGTTIDPFQYTNIHNGLAQAVSRSPSRSGYQAREAFNGPRDVKRAITEDLAVARKKLEAVQKRDLAVQHAGTDAEASSVAAARTAIDTLPLTSKEKAAAHKVLDDQVAQAREKVAAKRQQEEEAQAQRTRELQQQVGRAADSYLARARALIATPAEPKNMTLGQLMEHCDNIANECRYYADQVRSDANTHLPHRVTELDEALNGLMTKTQAIGQHIHNLQRNLAYVTGLGETSPLTEVGALTSPDQVSEFLRSKGIARAVNDLASLPPDNSIHLTSPRLGGASSNSTPAQHLRDISRFLTEQMSTPEFAASPNARATRHAVRDEVLRYAGTNNDTVIAAGETHPLYRLATVGIREETPYGMSGIFYVDSPIGEGQPTPLVFRHTAQGSDQGASFDPAGDIFDVQLGGSFQRTEGTANPSGTPVRVVVGRSPQRPEGTGLVRRAKPSDTSAVSRWLKNPAEAQPAEPSMQTGDDHDVLVQAHLDETGGVVNVSRSTARPGSLGNARLGGKPGPDSLRLGGHGQEPSPTIDDAYRSNNGEYNPRQIGTNDGRHAEVLGRLVEEPRATLTRTQAELATARANLEQANSAVQRLEGEVAALQNHTAELKASVSSAKEKVNGNADIINSQTRDTLNDNLNKAREAKTRAELDLARLKEREAAAIRDLVKAKVNARRALKDTGLSGDELNNAVENADLVLQAKLMDDRLKSEVSRLQLTLNHATRNLDQAQTAIDYHTAEQALQNHNQKINSANDALKQARATQNDAHLHAQNAEAQAKTAQARYDEAVAIKDATKTQLIPELNSQVEMAKAKAESASKNAPVAKGKATKAEKEYRGLDEKAKLIESEAQKLSGDGYPNTTTLREQADTLKQAADISEQLAINERTSVNDLKPGVAKIKAETKANQAESAAQQARAEAEKAQQVLAKAEEAAQAREAANRAKEKADQLRAEAEAANRAKDEAIARLNALQTELSAIRNS